MPECRKNESGTLCILVERKNNPEYQKENTMNEFMTIKQVGAHLKLSAQSIKRLIREGRLVAYRFGQCSYRISEEAVQALLTRTLAGPTVDALDEKEDAK
jgi:excisionase family DNA binding protein